MFDWVKAKQSTKLSLFERLQTERVLVRKYSVSMVLRWTKGEVIEEEAGMDSDIQEI